MGYDHSLTTTVRLKDDIEVEKIAQAIAPITKHFDVDPSQPFGKYHAGDFECDIKRNDDGSRWLYIYTAGDVPDCYGNRVEEAAANLGPLVEHAGSFTLKNFDTAELENAIEEFAFGSSPGAIEAMKRNDALDGAIAILRDYLDEATLGLVRGLAQRLMEAKRDVAPVTYWDSRQYNCDSGLPAKTAYLMEVEDQRETSGQLRVVLAAEDGSDKDQIDAFFEINRLNHIEAADDLPCAHLAFDADNMAFSVFKQGDRFILRPENGVTIERGALDSGEKVWIVE